LQDTRTPLVVAVTTSVVNLVLEVILIGGLGFGIGASALATVVVQWAGTVVYLVVVRRAVRRFEVRLSPDPASVRRQARVGGNLFIRTAALRASLVLSTAVATRISTASLGAHQIAFQLWSFLALSLDAIAIAAQAMVGRYLGAGDRTSARASTERMLWWGVVGGVVFMVVIVLLRPVLPQLFSDDAEVVAQAGFLLWFVALLQPVNAVAFVLDGVLIGASDVRFLAWAMLGAAVVFGAAAGAVLVLAAGIGWLWASIGLLMVVRAVSLGFRYRGDTWLVVGAPERSPA
jgi:putative MATE family efflux protein